MTINLDPPEGLRTTALEAEAFDTAVLTGDGVLKTPYRPRILGVGTAASSTVYSQQEVLDAFGITDARISSVFRNSAIERRHLTLPEPDGDGVRHPEPQGDLLDKHKALAVEMGAEALRACLKRAGAELSDLRHLCCVSSTGFLTPGLSALMIRELGIDRHCGRSDIVGMGCNAGLNALNVVAGWSAAHPGELAVVLCTEACSAAYAMDSSMHTAVVNSLFGDGAGAIALMSGPGDEASAPCEGPTVLKFASCIIPDAIDAMRYDWDRELDRFSFYLDPQIPYVVGAHAESVVDRLLTDTGLRRGDIRHWLVHSGGKKVIDAVTVNLGLTRYDLRHTVGVLRDHGNVSSGSFLYSYERLLDERVTRPGDYGVLMTMGPGSTLETALVQW
ncbi:type III polyketide synthase [Streptomyces sp. NA02950]|uniref:3,5-dihydroxyphenylacetyl-CoA synthase DpgA n=1 Tax=Streptomyces sp. NA02950 TaxID=2742137 RepID=UPI0015916002|nr:3,5-dihydroxyphenylacetyl-CoA synthase DpgA [Streptomyces sp. NA02950]QKV90547.1 type III polyketide synthase [Streptomyces sp. NA02950]